MHFDRCLKSGRGNNKFDEVESVVKSCMSAITQESAFDSCVI